MNMTGMMVKQKIYTKCWAASHIVGEIPIASGSESHEALEVPEVETTHFSQPTWVYETRKTYISLWEFHWGVLIGRINKYSWQTDWWLDDIRVDLLDPR